MIELPTPAEVAQVAEDALRVELDAEGLGTPDLSEGSRLTALVSLQSAVFTRLGSYAADRAAASRMSTASGEDLDIIGRDDYGEDRKPDVCATGAVRLLRAGGGAATSIPQGSRFAVPATESTPAVTFTASATVPVLSGETLVDVPLVAVEPGPSGNIPLASDVSQVVDTLPESGWSITTPVAGTIFGGGMLRETDAEFQARLSVVGTEDSRRRGTRRAILAGVLRVPGVAHAVAVEPYNGSVVVYAGDPSYRLSSALRTAILTELLEWRCFGVPVDVRPFAPETIEVQATVYMERAVENYDVGAIRATATAAVLAYFEGRERPDEYFRDRITAAVGMAHGEVQHVVLSLPSSDHVRPADTTYGGASSIARYTTSESSVRILVTGPMTT